MIWAGVPWQGKTELPFASCKIGSLKYCSVLDEYYQPYVETHFSNGEFFQQDGVPVHTALFTKEYLCLRIFVTWTGLRKDLNLTFLRLYGQFWRGVFINVYISSMIRKI